MPDGYFLHCAAPREPMKLAPWRQSVEGATLEKALDAVKPPPHLPSTAEQLNAVVGAGERSAKLHIELAEATMLRQVRWALVLADLHSDSPLWRGKARHAAHSTDVLKLGPRAEERSGQLTA